MRFVLDPIVEALDPPSAPLEGECPLKLTGQCIVDSGALKVRFTKLPPYEEGTTPELPDAATAERLEVDATFSEGAVDVVAPAFEGAEEPFDAAVQLAADGQVYGPSFAVLKYEAAAAKGKKK